MEQLTEKITQYLIDNYEKFQHAHVGGADRLVLDATDFFNDGNFNRDCVDIIVEATGQALGYKVVIFMKSPAGNIEKYVTGDLNASDTVFLKFTSSGGKHTVGNHYDSISHIINPNSDNTGHIEIIPETDEETPPSTQLTVITQPETDEDIPLLPQPEGDHYIKDIDNYSVQKFLRPRTKFPHHIYEECTPKPVQYLPSNVNGNCVYKVPATPTDYTPKTTDRRWFLMRTTSGDSSTAGIRKIGICQGSFICQNDTCSYITTSGQPNEYHWEYQSGNRVCYQCGQFATRLHCGAKKYVHLPSGSNVATVYHLGNHTCKLKPDSKYDATYTQKWLQQFPSLSFNKFKSTVIKHLLDLGNIEGAHEAAERITRQAYTKTKRESLDPQEFLPHSLEAVSILKEGSDKNDHFYIYEINNGKMNNKPDYVMKSSKVMLLEALKMDQDAEVNDLQKEDAYFDGCHSRCQGFVSLGLWVMHPALKKIIRLASMECRSESTSTIEIFWTLFNRMLREVGNKPQSYLWNPKFILNDEAGANFLGASKVFGTEFASNKIVTCQWHFLNKVNERIHYIGESHRQEFINLAKELTTAKTIPQFELAYKRMDEICNKYPATGFFLGWYYARRSHLFPAFRQGIHSGLNLAEVGNAKWKAQHKLSLVKAASDDIASMITQAAELKRCIDGENFTRGGGLNDRQRAARERRDQVHYARSMAELFSNQEALDLQVREHGRIQDNYFERSASSKHKPRNKTSTVEGKEVRRGRGRGRGRTRGRGRVSVSTTRRESLNTLLDKIAKARAIDEGSQDTETEEDTNEQDDGGPKLGNSSTPRPVRPIPPTSSFPNPPTITQKMFNISRCQGCKNPIDKNMDPPNDLIFKIKCIRPYENNNHYYDKIANGYCHLTMKCLKNHNNDVKEEDITTSSDIFKNLTETHFKHLSKLGMLKFLIANKVNEISND